MPREHGGSLSDSIGRAFASLRANIFSVSVISSFFLLLVVYYFYASPIQSLNLTQSKIIPGRKSSSQPEPEPVNSASGQQVSKFDIVLLKEPQDEDYRRRWSKYQLWNVLKTDAAERIERERDRNDKELRRRLPQVLTIGVAKCGTHALNFFLQLNPSLATSHLETNFFVFWDRYRQGYSWYRQRMYPSYPDQITMDQGTFYAQNPGILPRVAAANKNMKFILVMCDPVARDISHFTHGQTFHGRPLDKTFEDKMFTETRKVIASKFHYNFDTLLQHWLPYVRNGRLHVVDGMRMKTDPVHELNLVEDFVGVPRVISDKLVVFNKTKGYFCKYEDREEVCMKSNIGHEHPDVAPWATHALREWYKPQMRRFSNLTGVRFDWMTEYF